MLPLAPLVGILASPTDHLNVTIGSRREDACWMQLWFCPYCIRVQVQRLLYEAINGPGSAAAGCHADISSYEIMIRQKRYQCSLLAAKRSSISTFYQFCSQRAEKHSYTIV